jgi:glycosyltransferase involved in cell wall biosynthesis
LERYFDPFRSRAIALVERRLALLSDALVVPSPETADELASLRVAARRKFIVVQPGLDVGALLSRPRPPDSSARERLGIARGRPVVAFAGRLVSIKDPLLFVAAARSIRHAMPDALFVVAGDGPLRKKMAAAGERAAPGRFVFLGWVEDMADLVFAADLFVMTSRHEGLPATLVEAMASGVGVVATRAGGIPGLVADGVAGLLVPAGDANAVASAAIDLLRDEPRRLALGAAARASIRERRFSPERMAGELRDLYVRLLAEKGIDPSSREGAA